MRDLLTTVGEVAGAASITAGAALVEVWLGLVIGGVLLITGCVLGARK